MAQLCPADAGEEERVIIARIHSEWHIVAEYRTAAGPTMDTCRNESAPEEET
jgi:hypothetical protein